MQTSFMTQSRAIIMTDKKMADTDVNQPHTSPNSLHLFHLYLCSLILKDSFSWLHDFSYWWFFFFLGQFSSVKMMVLHGVMKLVCMMLASNKIKFVKALIVS